MNKLIPTESQEQCALIEMCAYHPILSKYLIKIPNEGKRSWKIGKRYKAEGLKKGVSDLFLAYPNTIYHGCWIEMKRKGTKVTPHQENWLSLMKSVGYDTIVTYSASEAMKFILEYLSIEFEIENIYTMISKYSLDEVKTMKFSVDQPIYNIIDPKTGKFVERYPPAYNLFKDKNEKRSKIVEKARNRRIKDLQYSNLCTEEIKKVKEILSTPGEIKLMKNQSYLTDVI